METKSFLEPTLEKQLKGHRNSITSIHYSPNEQQIATGSLDNSVLLWDVRGALRSYRFRGHDEAVMDVTFSPTGKYMASASRDKTVRLWVPTVTGSTGMFKAHSQTVRSVQFTPDSSKILTASDDKIVKLWSSMTHKFITSFVGHTNWVRSARISNDGSVIASCSDDKLTKLWNPDSGECIHTYKDNKGYGLCLAWHPSGCFIAIGTSQGNVKLYDIRTHNLVQYYSIHDEAVTQLAFHPSGSFVITASKDGKMKILDLLEGHPVFTLSAHTGPINAVGFSPSGDSFASAGDDKMVYMWKTNFTELQADTENMPQNVAPIQKSSSEISNKKQGATWNQCYHSSRYPPTTFVHLNDIELSLNGSANQTRIDPTINNVSMHMELNPNKSSEATFREPNANSTLLNTSHSPRKSIPRPYSVSRHDVSFMPVSPEASGGNTGVYIHDDMLEDHIPRVAPSPATYTIPSVIDKSVDAQETSLYGMISLKVDDVCYTSGKIEWVGRKRSYPLNSGFKLLKDNRTNPQYEQPNSKRTKNQTMFNSSRIDKMRECECADVLPTMHAIVDHLSALHEAVDIVDLRLNNLESKNND